MQYEHLQQQQKSLRYHYLQGRNKELRSVGWIMIQNGTLISLLLPVSLLLSLSGKAHLDGYVLVCQASFSLLGNTYLLAGILSVCQGRKPVTELDVSSYMQHEYQALLARKHGWLPFQYRWWFRALVGINGLFMLEYGLHLLIPYTQNSLIDSFGTILAGIGFLWVATLSTGTARRRYQQATEEALRFLLIAGETHMSHQDTPSYRYDEQQ